jgi:hypothetical protein
MAMAISNAVHFTQRAIIQIYCGGSQPKEANPAQWMLP